MITKIVEIIKQWKRANGGVCPTFSDIHATLGVADDDLAEEISKAQKMRIVYQPQNGRYDVVPENI